MLQPLTLMLILASTDPCEPLAYVTQTDSLTIERHEGTPSEAFELCSRDKVERGDDKSKPDPEVIFTDRDQRVTLLPLSRFVVRPIESCGTACWIKRVLGIAEDLIGDDKESISASVAMLPAETADPYAFELFRDSQSAAFISNAESHSAELPVDLNSSNVNLDGSILNVPAHIKSWRIPMDTFAIEQIRIINSDADRPFENALWETDRSNATEPLKSAFVPVSLFHKHPSLRLILLHQEGLSMHRIKMVQIDRSLGQKSDQQLQLAAQLLEEQPLRWAFYAASILESNDKNLAKQLYFGRKSR